MTHPIHKQQSIRAQIMRGYVRVILFACILGLLTLILLGALYWNYQTVNHEEESRLQIQQIIVSHYSWRSQLSSSLQNGTEFTGSLDPTACSFGKWVQQNINDHQADPEVVKLVEAVEAPHTEMHTAAAALVELSKTDPEAAVEQFTQDVEPYTNEVIDSLGNLDDYYTQQVQQARAAFQTLLLVILLVIVLITAGIAVYSVRYAKHLAGRISRPVVRMAGWANQLALGKVDSQADEEFRRMEEENQGNEIGGMMQSFQAMATNIEQNVHVLQRVSGGDMTTFVHIHSQEDILGKSIYHMVQSNNAVFQKIVEAAHTVANGAGQISDVSHTLAESSTEQAAAVQQLSDAIAETSDLIRRNDEQAQRAKEITEKIKTDTEVSNQHMKQLVDSVMRIQQASQRISAVVKSIDDIAFETNILSLNAAIEAARAGSAGKGFAVVAEEVRNLALKSAEAAQESKNLIQSSIDEATQGSVIAAESAKIFDAINDEILQVVEIVGQVSELSDAQMEGISTVNQQSSQISEAASSNAAISEQSSASSEDMSQQAEILRQSMAHFKLRETVPGQAYIPPEKRNDAAFIAAANEAYHYAEQTGKAGQREYIDPAS